MTLIPDAVVLRRRRSLSTTTQAVRRCKKPRFPFAVELDMPDSKNLLGDFSELLGRLDSDSLAQMGKPPEGDLPTPTQSKDEIKTPPKQQPADSSVSKPLSSPNDTLGMFLIVGGVWCSAVGVLLLASCVGVYGIAAGVTAIVTGLKVKSGNLRNFGLVKLSAILLICNVIFLDVVSLALGITVLVMAAKVKPTS